MTFKHQLDITTHCPKDCPPVNAQQKDITAYRLVNDPITGEDFKTYVQLGKLPRATHEVHEKCMHCGLSLYASLSKAEKHVRKLPNKSKLECTHVAEGDILQTHGMCTKPKHKSSHFTIHEFTEVELLPVFTLLKSIEDWKI